MTTTYRLTFFGSNYKNTPCSFQCVDVNISDEECLQPRAIAMKAFETHRRILGVVVVHNLAQKNICVVNL